MKKVRFLKRAIQDLIEIDEHTRAHSPRGAARVGARIRKRADDLARFPESGTLSEKTGLRQLYVAKAPYMLISPSNAIDSRPNLNQPAPAARPASISCTNACLGRQSASTV